MVRVNLINPRNLADQHLVAEYNEILMLVGHVRKHGVDVSKIPAEFCLGTGHINFFKNKIGYLKRRHKLIKKEMRRRGFRARKSISLNSRGVSWSPSERNLRVIRKRLVERIRQKPDFYRYCGELVGEKFLVGLVLDAKI